MNKQFRGFIDFVRQQGVVGLAVGLAIGTQAGKTVEAIVKGFISPIVAFIVGNNQSLEQATWTVYKSSSRSLVISWGSILSSLITLLAVAAVIYFVVNGLRLSRLDKEKGK